MTVNEWWHLTFHQNKFRPTENGTLQNRTTLSVSVNLTEGPDMKVKETQNLPKRGRRIEGCRDGNPTERSKQEDEEEWKLKSDEKTPIRGQEVTDIERDRMTEGKRACAHHPTLCRADWWLTEWRWHTFHVADLCHSWRHHCLHFFTVIALRHWHTRDIRDL